MRLIIAAIFLLSLSNAPLTAKAADTTSNTVDKARLQAAMQQHIERQLVDSAILRLDTSNGEVKSYYPTKAHPMILQMGEHFVLCADLKDEAGKSTPLDLYMAPKGRRFVVYHTEIGNRGPLKRMMKNGLIKRLK